MSIYTELSDFENTLDEMLENANGEITQEIEDFLNYQEETKQDCMERLGKVILRKQATIRAKKEEAKRLSDSANIDDNKVKGILRYAKFLLKGESFEAKTLKFSSRKTTKVIVDENLIDSKYMNEKITLTPDKKLIKEAIEEAAKNKETFIGAELLVDKSMSVK